MGQREASLRLNLRSSNFVNGLEQIQNKAKAVGQRIGQALKQPTVAGLNSVKESFGGTVEKGKELGKNFLALSGVLSAGAAVKGAVELNDRYRDLAFQVQTASKRATDWRDIQQQIEPLADDNAMSANKLADAYSSVLEETGSAGFALAALKAAGPAANATGKSVESLAAVLGVARDKFEITDDEAKQTTADLIELANRGGVAWEDLAGVLSLTGASARAAGLMGADGMKKMIALFNIGGDALGNTKKGVGAITQLFDQFADPNVSKEIRKNFNVMTKDASGAARDMTDVLGDIFTKTGGKREKLAKVFSGEQLKLVTELGKFYTAAFDSTEGDVKAKTAAGLAAYQDALAQAGKTTLKFSDLEAEAATRMKGSSAAMRRAFNEVEEAFSKPEMQESIAKLAQELPKIAHLFADLVEFAADNPITALGAAGGLKFGGAFLSGAIKNALEDGGKSASGKLADGGSVAGKNFAQKAFAVANIAGVAAMLSAALIGSLVEYETARAKQKEDERRREIVEKGDKVAKELALAQGGDRREAEKILGKEKTDRLRRNELTAEERKALEDRHALEAGGLTRVDQAEKARTRVGDEQQKRIQKELGLTPSGEMAMPFIYDPEKGKFNAPAPALPSGADKTVDLIDLLKGGIKVEITNPQDIARNQGGGGGGSHGLPPNASNKPGYQGA